MGLDSVELVLAIEEDFQIEISNEVTARVLSVRHMRDLIVDELRRVGREANPDAVFSRLRGISSSNWRSSHPRSYSTLSSCATFASIERYKLILTPLCKLQISVLLDLGLRDERELQGHREQRRRYPAPRKNDVAAAFGNGQALRHIAWVIGAGSRPPRSSEPRVRTAAPGRDTHERRCGPRSRRNRPATRMRGGQRRS